MNDIMQSRIASGLSVLAGIWLLVTPLMISMTGNALTSIYVVGGVMVAAGLVQLFWFNTMPSWINVLATLWLFISAFVLTMSTAASWNQIIVAIVAFAIASWDNIEASEVQRHRHASA